MKSNNIPEQKHDPYMLRINKGEKLYKIFIFKPNAGKVNSFEYRILTKEMKNGLLELVSYNFKIVDNIPQKYSIMRATDVGKEKIKSIINNVKQTTNTSEEEFEEIDLSIFDTIEEQIKFLEKRERINKEYIM